MMSLRTPPLDPLTSVPTIKGQFNQIHLKYNRKVTDKSNTEFVSNIKQHRSFSNGFTSIHILHNQLVSQLQYSRAIHLPSKPAAYITQGFCHYDAGSPHNLLPTTTAQVLQTHQLPTAGATGTWMPAPFAAQVELCHQLAMSGTPGNGMPASSAAYIYINHNQDPWH